MGIASRIARLVGRRDGVIVPEYPVRPRARWGWDGQPVHPELAALFDRADERSRAVLGRATDLLDWARSIPRSAGDGGVCWDNDWWGGLDALVHVALLRDRNPQTYLEVGSGYSTRFARRAIIDFGLRTRIVSVDPQPRAEIDALCDEVIRRPFEDVADELLGRIAPSDVVLFDGSHMTYMNSDAVVMLLELFPRMPDGVVVAVDDVYLPYDYHPTWAQRFYGEQYVLAAFLLGGGGGWDVLFPAMHVTQSPAHADALEPIWAQVESRYGRVASSMWLERSGVSHTSLPR